MSGVPEIPYDFGEDCPTCQSINFYTPLKFRMNFKNLKKIGFPATNISVDTIADQRPGIPCEYLWVGVPFFASALYTYGNYTGNPALSNILLARDLFPDEVFKATFAPGCVLSGIFDNVFTFISPSPLGWYGGTCELDVY